MLTILLLCICVRHFFILRHLCSMFILLFPLLTILIISRFLTLCIIHDDIYNKNKKKPNKTNNWP